MLAMLLFTAAGGPAVLVFALQLAGEMLDIYACADVPLVQRGAVLACAFAREPGSTAFWLWPPLMPKFQEGGH